MADAQAVPLAVYLETWADDINKNSGKSVDADQLRKIAGWIRSEAAENERLREALTPSAGTKAAYIGEFTFSVELSHPRLGSDWRRISVPWDTVKEIMAAIRERAALSEQEGK